VTFKITINPTTLLVPTPSGTWQNTFATPFAANSVWNVKPTGVVLTGLTMWFSAEQPFPTNVPYLCVESSSSDSPYTFTGLSVADEGQTRDVTIPNFPISQMRR